MYTRETSNEDKGMGAGEGGAGEDSVEGRKAFR